MAARALSTTCVLPTRGRADLLRRTLRFMASRPNDHFIIADSSKASVHKDNIQTLSNLNLKNVTILSYDYDYPFYKKIAHALKFVKTKYFYFLADDDYFFDSGINICVTALENDKTLASAAGRIFVYGGENKQNASIFPEKFSIYPACGDLAKDSALRVSHHLSNYMATFYSVYRTKLAQRAFDEIAKRTINLRLAEIMSSCYILSLGRRKLIDCDFALRITHEDALHHHIPLLRSDLENEAFHSEFIGSLGGLCKLISENSKHSPDVIESALQVSSSVYLNRVGVPSSTISSLIEQVSISNSEIFLDDYKSAGFLVKQTPSPGETKKQRNKGLENDLITAISLTEIAPKGIPDSWEEDYIIEMVRKFKDTILVQDTWNLDH